jgi:glycine/D-amino acid oxidase-like deaminating enzyme
MMPFPITADQPARFVGPLPKSCDVVVIGGGVIGVMTAWHLAERGLSVVMCEKGRIAGEQSSRNWGWIRQQGRDLAELPIMVESLSIWKALAREFGAGLGFRQDGVLYLARTDAELADYAAWMTAAQGHGLDTQIISQRQVQERLTGSVGPWIGGLLTPSDARAEPWFAVPMLAEGAVTRGVVIAEDCAVRRLDRAGGRVAGVITERGRIAADQVVMAGGAWSSLFLRAEGVIIPQLAVLASVAATESLPQVFAGNAVDDRFAFRRRLDGGYTLAPGGSHDFHVGPDAFRHLLRYLPVLKKDFRSTHFRAAAPRDHPDAWTTRRHWSGDEVSPFERMRVLNPGPNQAALDAVVADFKAAFPGLGAVALKSVWAGMIDTMPDVVPVIDRVATVPGLVFATGLSGHGFGIGPGVGRVVADLVAGNAVGHDLTRFRLSRFSDGSKVRAGPSL